MDKVKNALEKSISAMSGLYGGWRCESAIRLCEEALAELEQSTAESTMLNTCLAFDKQEPAQAEDQSNSSIQLAKMIMSDCGVSDNCESLVNRIAGRIDAAQKQEQAQGFELSCVWRGVMDKVKVKYINDGIMFDNGIFLSSDHTSDCCESHYLDFTHITIDEFEGLEFDLTQDDFFERIDDYGIALKPLNGHPVRIPGYGYNNGYYSSHLDLVLSDWKGFKKVFDISKCQDITD